MNTKRFNGERLRTARLYRGLTIEELSEKLNVSKQSISQYETGRVEAPYEKTHLLSWVLDFPFEYFMQSKEHEVTTGTTYFRSLLKTSKKYRTEQIVKMEHLAIIFSILNEYVEFPKVILPTIGEQSNPSIAAQSLRDCWGLGQEPVLDIIRVLERNGIIVTMIPTATNDIDAFSQFISVHNQDLFLIALSKNKDTAARIHFDIAHELGHIMLHPWSEDEESFSREDFKAREKEANEFAANFLLPEIPFSKDASAYPSTLEYYTRLKKKWRVSIAAMLYRSCSLDIISQSQFQYLLRTMHNKNWRTNEPLDNTLTTASPSLLKNAIEALLTNNVFTPNELMKELENEGLPMRSSEVEILLNLPQGTLNTSVTTEPNIINLRK